MNLIVCRLNYDALEAVKIIDNAISVIWIQRYNEAGEFELYLKATPEMLQLFSTERYIIREDSSSIMITERVLMTTDTENGNFITVSGRSAEALLARRVANRLYNYSDINVELLVRSLIRSTIGDQSGSERLMPIVALGSSFGLTNTIGQIQLLGDNILDVISSLAKTYNFGFRMQYNNTDSNMIFRVYQGTDRTFDQNTVRAVIFSPEYNNLASSEYDNDKTNTKNVAYVAGEKINGIQTIVSTPTSSIPTGIARREEWIEAGDKTQKGSLTDAQYESVLRTTGNNSLSQLRENVNFSGEVIYNTQFKYGRDYYLGDKVQIANGYGITGSAYVTEITEVEDDTGYSIHPTLSRWSTSN